MKTMTPRLENAVTKLYNAFHNGNLDMGECKHCAVGNIIGHDNWFCGSPDNYLYGEANPNDEIFELDSWAKNESGYSLQELKMVEYYFIVAHKKERNADSKKHQFKGLCAVVKYLCELDNYPNIMEIQSLFEFDENKKPVNELTF